MESIDLNSLISYDLRIQFEPLKALLRSKADVVAVDALSQVSNEHSRELSSHSSEIDFLKSMISGLAAAPTSSVGVSEVTSAPPSSQLISQLSSLVGEVSALKRDRANDLKRISDLENAVRDTIPRSEFDILKNDMLELQSRQAEFQAIIARQNAMEDDLKRILSQLSSELAKYSGDATSANVAVEDGGDIFTPDTPRFLQLREFPNSQLDSSTIPSGVVEVFSSIKHRSALISSSESKTSEDNNVDSESVDSLPNEVVPVRAIPRPQSAAVRKIEGDSFNSSGLNQPLSRSNSFSIARSGLRDVGNRLIDVIRELVPITAVAQEAKIISTTTSARATVAEARLCDIERRLALLDVKEEPSPPVDAVTHAELQSASTRLEEMVRDSRKELKSIKEAVSTADSTANTALELAKRPLPEPIDPTILPRLKSAENKNDTQDKLIDDLKKTLQGIRLSMDSIQGGPSKEWAEGVTAALSVITGVAPDASAAKQFTLSHPAAQALQALERRAVECANAARKCSHGGASSSSSGAAEVAKALQDSRDTRDLVASLADVVDDLKAQMNLLRNALSNTPQHSGSGDPHFELWARREISRLNEEKADRDDTEAALKALREAIARMQHRLSNAVDVLQSLMDSQPNSSSNGAFLTTQKLLPRTRCLSCERPQEWVNSETLNPIQSTYGTTFHGGAQGMVLQVEGTAMDATGRDAFVSTQIRGRPLSAGGRNAFATVKLPSRSPERKMNSSQVHSSNSVTSTVFNSSMLLRNGHVLSRPATAGAQRSNPGTTYYSYSSHVPQSSPVHSGSPGRSKARSPSRPQTAGSRSMSPLRKLNEVFPPSNGGATEVEMKNEVNENPEPIPRIFVRRNSGVPVLGSGSVITVTTPMLDESTGVPVQQFFRTGKSAIQY